MPGATSSARGDELSDRDGDSTGTRPAVPKPAMATTSVMSPGEVRGESPAPQGSYNNSRSVDRVSLLLFVVDVLVLAAGATLMSGSTVASVALVAGVVVVLQARGLYQSRLTLSIIDDLPVVTAGFVAVAGVTSVLLVPDTGVWAVVLWSLAVLVMLIGGRSASYAAVRLARRRGWVAYRTLIVGTGPTARRVARTLDEHPEHGLRVVGFLGPRLDLDRSVREGIVGEDPGQLDLVTELHDVDVVVVTYLGSGSDALLRSLRTRDPRSSYTMYLVPPLFQMLHTPGRERIRDIAVIKLRPAAASVLAWRAKRLVDIAVSLLALVLLSPLMLAVALAVLLEVGPHVLFRQTRVGRWGRHFTLLKFRSLRPEDPGEASVNWSVSNDVRIGRVGKFIRRTSLDELPQLFNILCGHMSLVGPRPERPYFVTQFAQEHDDYQMRLRVRPGLTGWAAVHGLRGDTSIQERAYFDNVYIDNWTLGMDVKIIARTLSSVLGGRGA